MSAEFDEKTYVPPGATKNPTREGLDMEAKGLDPNRPLPPPPPENIRWWDKTRAVPPLHLFPTAHHRKEYGRRYFPQEDLSFFDRFFGSQAKAAAATKEHPCEVLGGRVHQCLEQNSDKVNMADFCRSIMNVYEGCLKEYNK